MQPGPDDEVLVRNADQVSSARTLEVLLGHRSSGF
jgi:hypothetical protein